MSDQKEEDMSDTTTLPHLNNLVGNYGPDWDRVGILSEHLHRVDCTIKVLGNGRPLAVSPDGRTARILCSEVVEVYTEEGTIDGRCGGRVESKDDCACPSHQALINSWRIQNEAEVLAWEKHTEEEDGR